ncbi:hypothetical protein PGT21_001640 [Puccinia graminis f. sp. tritici]|uniref:Uncharacterized protein n=1 Tax=Puccinia graminis f. sp. tritici TaxID=56615 RepID=A0A5B0QZF7_PUCGR|nr:hypothetical protein PGT21_001640 [Puccinia graminis f. sp. tritici]
MKNQSMTLRTQVPPHQKQLPKTQTPPNQKQPAKTRASPHQKQKPRSRPGGPKLDWPSKICINRPKQKRDNPVKLKSITSEFPDEKCGKKVVISNTSDNATQSTGRSSSDELSDSTDDSEEGELGRIAEMSISDDNSERLELSSSDGQNLSIEEFMTDLGDNDGKSDQLAEVSTAVVNLGTPTTLSKFDHLQLSPEIPDLPSPLCAPPPVLLSNNPETPTSEFNEGVAGPSNLVPSLDLGFLEPIFTEQREAMSKFAHDIAELVDIAIDKLREQSPNGCQDEANDTISQNSWVHVSTDKQPCVLATAQNPDLYLDRHPIKSNVQDKEDNKSLENDTIHGKNS